MKKKSGCLTPTLRLVEHLKKHGNEQVRADVDAEVQALLKSLRKSRAIIENVRRTRIP
jgi:hypothetical protein